MGDHERSRRPRVHFNEEEIAAHDKDRGTRQKIDEPPTPYERSVKPVENEDGKLVDFNQLTDEMTNMNLEKTTIPSVSDNVRALTFEEKRRKHYNEFHKMKQHLKRQEEDS